MEALQVTYNKITKFHSLLIVDGMVAMAFLRFSVLWIWAWMHDRFNVHHSLAFDLKIGSQYTSHRLSAAEFTCLFSHAVAC